MPTPFVYSDGKWTSLGFQGAALDINVHGDIVGWSATEDIARRRAFLYTNGKKIDLGTFDGFTAQATRIDSSGRVVVSVDFTRAILYVAGTGYDLRSLIVSGVAPDDLPMGSVIVIDMNSRGQILATICAVDCKKRHTYLLNPG